MKPQNPRSAPSRSPNAPRSKKEQALLRRRQWTVGVLALLLAGGPLVGLACSRAEKMERKDDKHIVRIGGQDVRVEIAADGESRSRGLMHVYSLPEDHGMLFVFPQPQVQAFYMKNCRMDIDIAYIDDDGVIVQTYEMKHYPPGYGGPYEHYHCRTPVRYALEVEGGWLAAHGVKVGDKVEGFRGPPGLTPL